jgi:hypothetical protein
MQTIGLILKLNLLGTISRGALRSATYLTPDVSRGIAEGYQYNVPRGAISTIRRFRSYTKIYPSFHYTFGILPRVRGTTVLVFSLRIFQNKLHGKTRCICVQLTQKIFNAIAIPCWKWVRYI